MCAALAKHTSPSRFPKMVRCAIAARTLRLNQQLASALRLTVFEYRDRLLGTSGLRASLKLHVVPILVVHSHTRHARSLPTYWGKSHKKTLLRSVPASQFHQAQAARRRSDGCTAGPRTGFTRSGMRQGRAAGRQPSVCFFAGHGGLTPYRSPLSIRTA